MEKHDEILRAEKKAKKITSMSSSELIDEAFKLDYARTAVDLLLSYVEDNDKVSKEFLVGTIKGMRNYLNK